MTFSIAARCERTGQFGTAVTTSSISVGARCPWVRAGVGAVMTQNITDPALGPLILDLLEQGVGAGAALQRTVSEMENTEYRQLSVIDNGGATAHFSGRKTLGTHAASRALNCVAAGNLLDNEGVPKAMVSAFARSDPDEELAERLMLALEAGMAAGGEAGPVHSAALKVCGDVIWPIVDLRVDWAEGKGVTALRSLWDLYRPQMRDYVIRAADPSTAPAYGVPGDE
jgi:uncharacterized Ntn-hydrolase superfamily protein